MPAKGYAFFGALAAALGLWGFYLGRQSTHPPKMQAAAVVQSVAPQPTAPDTLAVQTPEPTAAPEPKVSPMTPAKRRPPVAVSTAQRQKAPPVPTAPTPTPTVESAPAPKAVIPPAPETAPAAIDAARVFKPEKEYESAAPPKPREPHTVTIPAGTLLNVRLLEGLSAERNSSGDTFAANLDQPLVVDGFVLAERGASVRGHIAELARAGRVKGRASLVLELKSLSTSDGQKIELETDTFKREGESGVKKDAARAGVMTAIGAAVGAIAGGGKGAAIGAGVGGAAGAGTVLATRGEDANLPAETKLTFRLKNPVVVTEKLD